MYCFVIGSFAHDIKPGLWLLSYMLIYGW